ncbi:hypothetical protein QLQ12_16445 [Actinoplanes sp. NEAU-A12]|uniref:DUF2092 domain-containing protein n=1 Tax=Actinoplanes sandaracinus TaxID=3045177 RepID=A0ABT6WKD6_9ACTN|nr:hypothetical protein [Actinoplanes sandaracinus]MDI6100195.1 hypothetical protein [Actinoplanes sandaracinus]
MPTQEHLRTAMNEMARSTDALSPTVVLHAARRRQTHRRLLAAVVTAAAVTAVSIGVAVATPSRPPDGPAPADTGDAGQALRDSVAALRGGNYTFTRTGTSSIADIQRAAVHLPDSVLLQHASSFVMVRAGSDTYLRYLLNGGPELRAQYRQYYKENLKAADVRKIDEVYSHLDGEHWVRADEKKLTEAAAVDEQSGLDYMAQMPTTEQPDATGAGSLIAAVTSAERAGNVITGTLDATKPDPLLELMFSDPTYLYGVGAKSMPYRATLDDQGRLTEFTVTMPDHRMASQPADPVQPEPPLVIRISEYGRTEAQSPPAQISGELSSLAYELLARDTD